MGIRTSKRYVTWSKRTEGSDNGVTAGTPVVGSLSANFSNWRDNGVPLKDFHKLISEGRSATTGLSGEVIRIEGMDKKMTAKLSRSFLVSGSWRSYPSTFHGHPTGCMQISDPGTPSVSESYANAVASKKFYKKVKACSESWNGLQWAGELREALRMFRNPLQALRRSARDDYLSALGRLKRQDPKSWASALSGTYLEWFYGWRPTLQDAKDIYDTIEILSSEREWRRPIHAVGRDEPQPTVITSNFQDDAFGFAFQTRVTNQQKCKVVYRGLYMRDVKRSGATWNASGIMQQAGLTLANFVPTIWELLPWSFLVDYFTNVGDILETYFTSTEDVRWINKTIRKEKFEHRIAQPHLPRCVQLSTGPFKRFDNLEFNQPAETLHKRVAFSRSVESPLLPTLQFEVPSSPAKWIAMGALFHQANQIHPQRYQPPISRLRHW